MPNSTISNDLKEQIHCNKVLTHQTTSINRLIVTKAIKGRNAQSRFNTLTNTKPMRSVLSKTYECSFGTASGPLEDEWGSRIAKADEQDSV
jgi:hypothetical protein